MAKILTPPDSHTAPLATEIHPADLKLVPLVPDRRAAASAQGAASAYGGYRPPSADDESATPVSVQAPSAPAPADARARLPALFEQLLREGGDGLFDAVERALVHAAFRHAHRNQVRSAKALGITRNMVRTLLKRHGLLTVGGSEGNAEVKAGDGDAAEDEVVPTLADGRFSLSAV